MSIILVLAAILLILVVLLQPGKGGGLTGGTFGGVAGQFNTMFGARRTTDFLQKFTIYLAAGIIILTVITNKFLLPSAATVEQRAPVTAGAAGSATTAPAPAPAQQQPAQQQPAQQQPAQQQPAQQPQQGR